MSFNVNFIGTIPFNTDCLPERKFLAGPGTERPIGMTIRDIHMLYWTVRSFRVVIGGVSLGDSSSQFLAGGGAGGSIIGSLGGLSAVNRNLSCGVVNIVGHTKILNTSVVRIREQPSFVNGGITQKSVQLDKSVNPNRLVQSISPSSEGALCSAGPIHRLISASSGSNGYVLIDFSDIIYGTGYGSAVRVPLYWPKIIIIGAANCFSWGSLATFGQNAVVMGGINFCNMGVISVYGNTTVSFPVVNSVNGRIEIGTRCCDRFFWDGKDSIRSEECKKDCESVETGDPNYGKAQVTRILNNSNTKAGASTGASNGFLGGGG
jgi:hypothetical protein